MGVYNGDVNKKIKYMYKICMHVILYVFVCKHRNNTPKKKPRITPKCPFLTDFVQNGILMRQTSFIYLHQGCLGRLVDVIDPLCPPDPHPHSRIQRKFTFVPKRKL